ncbi:MAG: NYN domain-containing protein [Cellulosilyticaceae bacterium]
MKRLVIGILAHVDAGKTTLSEAILYTGGKLRKLGRVDKKDAYLDTYELERQRGITIFSKQAKLTFEDTEITLLDTPGHVDFSAEMERTLQVLDYAILVISGADGVQGHTETLWYLLDKYNVPTFIFVNKVDQQGVDKENVQKQLEKVLSKSCISFEEPIDESFYEQVAMCNEMLLETYLETNNISETLIKEAIKKRMIFPVCYGSALKLDGVQYLMDTIIKYSYEEEDMGVFGAKVFKISRDEKGNRLTHIKITQGSLKVKDMPCENEDKVNQIRIYSGEKYDTVSEVSKGVVCAVTGLQQTYVGNNLGCEKSGEKPYLEPVLTYKINLPNSIEPQSILPKFMQLAEEDPMLQIIWNQSAGEIQVKLMGEVQIEILSYLIKERFGIEVTFGQGNIVYKETIQNTVEGVGHFEPLRHYAEAHILIEPLEEGSGIQYEFDCSEDELAKNWQRLIMTHLQEKKHKGVLIGADVTDVKYTVIGGKAHNKHTEGGDFREATYRAVRQGLKQAKSSILEPYYNFKLQVPDQMLGRAMTDLEKSHAQFESPIMENGQAIIIGSAPVVTVQHYAKEVLAYTKGRGRFFCSFSGYKKCHNEENVLEKIAYDSELDMDNPSGSVFCKKGVGYTVVWDNVFEHMHIPARKEKCSNEDSTNKSNYKMQQVIGTDEIDAILNRAYNANKKEDYRPKQYIKKRVIESYNGPVHRSTVRDQEKESYVVVDAYNIIFGIPYLNNLAEENMETAKDRLIDILCNYQAYHNCYMMIVFDAYRVEGHLTEIKKHHNVLVVYTKEKETADQFIEKFAHQNASNYRITVATSDVTEQIVTRGQGCYLLSAQELYEAIGLTEKKYWEEYENKKIIDKNYMIDSLEEKSVKHLRAIQQGEIKS